MFEWKGVHSENVVEGSKQLSLRTYLSKKARLQTAEENPVLQEEVPKILYRGWSTVHADPSGTKVIKG